MYNNLLTILVTKNYKYSDKMNIVYKDRRIDLGLLNNDHSLNHETLCQR